MLVYRTYLLHILPLFRDEIIILQSHLPMPAKIRVKMGDRLEGIVDPAITRFEQGCEAGEGPCQLHSSASPGEDTPGGACVGMEAHEIPRGPPTMTSDVEWLVWAEEIRCI